LALEFNRCFRESLREGDDLKLKFRRLKSVKKPTGDPTCPPQVVRAKRIYRGIERKMNVQWVTPKTRLKQKLNGRLYGRLYYEKLKIKSTLKSRVCPQN
jgi:hypothetical protein